MVDPADWAGGAPHVHFIAIGGAGMGAIAGILLEKGYRVSGSDVAESEMTDRLARGGATVYLGHDAAHVRGADLVVYSTALPADNVELRAARSAGLPVLHRSEMLARLLNQGEGIAIAGAHGKTTTTAMIACILAEAGLDPTFLVGGVIGGLGTGARAGCGRHIVAEADESDRSFLNYNPAMAVITNIEPDHLEHYGGDFSNLIQAYADFAARIKEGGLLVGCADDDRVRALLRAARCRTESYTVTGREADYAAREIAANGRGAHARVFFAGSELGRITLRVPGVHNVANALAAIAVAREAGAEFPAIAAALAKFTGALRRFQTLYDGGGITVVDDYAHHPTEIRAAIHALKSPGRRLIAVFQPQRYTRTHLLFDQFALAFAEADRVVIADIYSPAGERPIPGVSAAALADAVRARSNPTAAHCPAGGDVLRYLQAAVRPGDLVLTMGAGDIWKTGAALAEWLRGRPAGAG